MLATGFPTPYHKSMGDDNKTSYDQFKSDVRSTAQTIAFILIIYAVYRWYKKGLGKFCWKLFIPIWMYAIYIQNYFNPSMMSKRGAAEGMIWISIGILTMAIAVLIGRKYFPDDE